MRDVFSFFFFSCGEGQAAKFRLILLYDYRWNAKFLDAFDQWGDNFIFRVWLDLYRLLDFIGDWIDCSFLPPIVCLLLWKIEYCLKLSIFCHKFYLHYILRIDQIVLGRKVIASKKNNAKFGFWEIFKTICNKLRINSFQLTI